MTRTVLQRNEYEELVKAIAAGEPAGYERISRILEATGQHMQQLKDDCAKWLAAARNDSNLLA